MKRAVFPQTEQQVTFSLPSGLVDEIRRLVEGGFASSPSELVRDALETYLRRQKREIEDERILKELSEAMQDPLFLDEERQIMKDFKHADVEVAMIIDQEPEEPTSSAK